MSDAQWAHLLMSEALDGSRYPKTLISDLAYGRKGWLQRVHQYIQEFHHPSQSCQLIRDTRPQSSRLHQPHRAYWIPLDLRAFRAPPHLMDRIQREDAKKLKRQKRLRRQQDARLGREIQMMAQSVLGGNHCLRHSGLLSGAFSSEPEVIHGIANYVPGVVGNPAWLPPKVKNLTDPPFVQHVRASSGCEFLRINARKPPHWLANRIAHSYKSVDRRLRLHEFYFYLAEDLRREEEFEGRLGIEDTGYWRYAMNYREYLRGKVKEKKTAADQELLHEMWMENQGEYQRMEGRIMKDQYEEI